MLGWINDNYRALGLIIAVIPTVWAILRYFALKRKEQRSERFNTYHKLIKELVEQDEADRPKMLDRQLAVVFELKRFNEYYEPSLRILEGLRKEWGVNNQSNRLLNEMDLTISVMKSGNRKAFHFFIFISRTQKVIILLAAVLILLALLFPPSGFKAHDLWQNNAHLTWKWIGDIQYTIQYDVLFLEIAGILSLAGISSWIAKKKEIRRIK